MRDLRLYYYDSGTLKKVDSRFHKHTSLAGVEEVLEKRLQNKYTTRFWSSNQFVVVEYFDKYDSKIVQIINSEVYASLAEAGSL